MSLLDFLFPRRCLGCGQKGAYFCTLCRQKIEPLELQIYPTSGALDGFFAVFPYQGMIRKAILQLKYNFVTDLADELIDLSTQNVKFSLFDYSKCPWLIPIPLYWQRKNWRGFNQTEILGKKLARRMGLKFVPDLLVRTRPTQPQANLKRKQRKANVRGAFKIQPNQKINRGPNILLFDDVWTTGATMKESARVLKKAGFKKIFGLTLAR